MPSGYLPLASAPSSHPGWIQKLAPHLLQHIAASGKLIGFDIVEFPLPHDDNHTSNLAATFIFYDPNLDILTKLRFRLSNIQKTSACPAIGVDKLTPLTLDELH